ncbi:MAG: TldD/PmbA family protein [Gemmatimonadaceae bacterium]
MTKRREFLRTSAAAAGLVVGGRLIRPAEAWANTFAELAPSDIETLLLQAVDALKSAGASFADARIGRYRRQTVATREQQIVNVVDTDSIGLGVRALVRGTWGFAGTRNLTPDGVTAAVREAIAIANANRLPGAAPVILAPGENHGRQTWKSAYVTDPWDIPVEEKAELLFRANAEAAKVPSVRFVSSGMSFVKEEKHYANTDGSILSQTIIRSDLPFNVTAVASDNSDSQSRGNVVQPIGRGYEYILAQDVVNNARHWGEQAAEKLKAKSVEAGLWDLVLHPSHLFLTIHESIGHSTELDRALGHEANMAGTSFLAPPREKLGAVRLGPDFMNFLGNRSEEGGCATIGFDDDGIKPDDFLIVKNGMFNDYQTTRELAPSLDWWYQRQNRPLRSHGNCHADSWSSVQFQRMPNVSLLPGEQERSWDDLIAATDKGIAMLSRGTYSIDQQRYNGQFGAQVCYEIRGGKIVGQLKDVAYVMRTPDFWNALDMLGGRGSYGHGATFNDGKGEPGQTSAVSHFCPPARFKNQRVINTGRTG